MIVTGKHVNHAELLLPFLPYRFLGDDKLGQIFLYYSAKSDTSVILKFNNENYREDQLSVKRRF